MSIVLVSHDYTQVLLKTGTHRHLW